MKKLLLTGMFFTGIVCAASAQTALKNTTAPTAQEYSQKAAKKRAAVAKKAAISRTADGQPLNFRAVVPAPVATKVTFKHS